MENRVDKIVQNLINFIWHGYYLMLSQFVYPVFISLRLTFLFSVSSALHLNLRTLRGHANSILSKLDVLKLNSFVRYY